VDSGGRARVCTGDTMQLVGSPWLIDLAAHSPNCKIFAASLLRCMIRTQRVTGHYLDLGDQQVRAKILMSANFGRIPTVPVECAYCGADATLAAWLNADQDMMREGWPDQRREISPEKYPAVAFRDPCKGVDMAKAVAHFLAPVLSVHYLESVEHVGAEDMEGDVWIT
jgi:hypothetical protein